MTKVLSIAAVALMVAGSCAFACGDEKKCDKDGGGEKTEQAVMQ